jgi:hypothetical protein
MGGIIERSILDKLSIPEYRRNHGRDQRKKTRVKKGY